MCEREIVGGWIEIGRERAGGGGREKERGREEGREAGSGQRGEERLTQTYVCINHTSCCIDVRGCRKWEGERERELVCVVERERELVCVCVVCLCMPRTMTACTTHVRMLRVKGRLGREGGRYG